MICQKWLIRLFAVLPCFLGFSVARTAEPMPPSTVCIDQSNCVSTTSSSAATTSSATNDGVKWHPGHYMQELPGSAEAVQTTRFQHYDLISSNKNVVGVAVNFRWKMLEGNTRGDYAAGIALVRAEINKLKSLAVPKRLFMRIHDIGYNAEYPATGYFPTYLQSACLVQTGPNPVRTVWRRWNSTCMGYYIGMLQAIAKEFDNEPFFEGLYVFGETAPNFGDTTPSDYTPEANDAQFRRLALAAKNMFPRSNVIVPLNYHNSTSATNSLMAYMHSIGVGTGNPDACPDCNMWGDRTLQGINGGVDYRGKIPVLWSVEASEMGYDSVGRDGGYTAQEIYNYVNGKLKASHIFWHRNMSVGTSEQRWDTGILPLINANPKPTNTACPLVYSSCNTN